MNALRKTADGITLINEKAAKAGSFFIYPLIFTIVVSVVSRYCFHSQVIWGYDMSWMLYGVISCLGCGYVLDRSGHVKVDVFYNMFGKRIQHMVSIITYIVFFFSSVIGLLVSSYNLFLAAIVSGEKSSFTSWTPILAPIRGVLLLSIALLLLQGFVIFGKHIAALVRGGEKE